MSSGHGSILGRVGSGERRIPTRRQNKSKRISKIGEACEVVGKETKTTDAVSAFSTCWWWKWTIMISYDKNEKSGYMMLLSMRYRSADYVRVCSLMVVFLDEWGWYCWRKDEWGEEGEMKWKIWGRPVWESRREREQGWWAASYST